MAAKQLILLRHAKSDWHCAARTDHDRPLSQRGRNDADTVGRWLGENRYQPQRAVCSSASRTRETLERVREAAGWREMETEFDAALYLASESTTVSMIADNLHAWDQLLIVGHNPAMDDVLLRFCPWVTANNHKLMTTAAMAIIAFADATLSGPELITFRRPAELTGPR